jgi:hypothetical protein
MNLAQLWSNLEGSITSDQVHGRRRLLGEGPIDLNITLTQPGPRRGLALTVDDLALVGVEELPSTRGLEHLRRPAGDPGRSVLEIRLTDPTANQMFVGLAEDVARAAASASDDEQSVGLWLSRIRSWQRLMASAPQGLSGERQRGLYAELEFLRTDLTPRVGVTDAVDGWQGPLGGHDFQLAGGAYEVKGSAAHEPQVVTINSERQLDETGTDSLHLVHLSLDVHQHAGESLPAIVAAVRGLAAGTNVEALLAERLVDGGYADVHEPHYSATGYTIRERKYFQVAEGFPRIIESELATGVGGVRYRLAIVACADFAVAPDDALRPLRRTS